jgi:hypothetical protein
VNPWVALISVLWSILQCFNFTISKDTSGLGGWLLLPLVTRTFFHHYIIIIIIIRRRCFLLFLFFVGLEFLAITKKVYPTQYSNILMMYDADYCHRSVLVLTLLTT